MLLKEEELRRLIRRSLIEQANDKDQGVNSTQNEIKEREAVSKLFKEKAIRLSGSSLYIEKDKTAKARNNKLISDLDDFLKKNWPHSEVSIKYNGNTRPMKQSLSGTGIRQAGTKHGLGLAFDLKYNLSVPEDYPEKYKKIADRKSLNFKYSLGSDIQINGVLGQKLLKKNKDNKIVMTYFIPSTIDNSTDLQDQIFYRKPPNEFRKVETGAQASLSVDDNISKLEFYDVIINYNKISDKKIKHDGVVDIEKFYSENLKLPKKPYNQGRNYDLGKNKEFIKLLYKFSQLDINKDLSWGGFWGSSDPKNGIVKDKGVDELHHWEYNTESGLALVNNPESNMNKIVTTLKPFTGVSTSDVCSNSSESKAARGKIYSLLLKNKDVNQVLAKK